MATAHHAKSCGVAVGWQKRARHRAGGTVNGPLALTRVTRRCREDSRDAVKRGLHAPEAAAGECGESILRAGVRKRGLRSEGVMFCCS